MSAASRSRDNAFVSVGLDRASERRGDSAWLDALARSDQSRFLVVDAAGQLLAHADGQLRWLDSDEHRQHYPNVVPSLLGLAGATAWWLLRVAHATTGAAAACDDGHWLGLRAIASRLDVFEAGLCAYACGLAHWQATTQYCPVCTAPLRWFDGGHRACCSNAACGRPQFPRSDPAIIVLVEHDGACLLGRQARWPEGRFSTLAGFVEPGEALEDAVRREVSEEAGVDVTDCDYYASQPWPFPASLMLGFHAHAASREIELRDGELAEARWFTPDDIVAGVHDGAVTLSSPVSISWHLLDYWMQTRAGINLRELPTASAAVNRSPSP